MLILTVGSRWRISRGLPAKKMPKFAKEFGGQNRNLDPKLPAKKRLPQEMIAAGWVIFGT